MTETAHRFEFGQNWEIYLSKISDEHVREAQRSFQTFTGLTSLQGKRFLDIGCGSGIHSYVAFLMGASEILSFDYDPFSVECTEKLKDWKAPEAAHWRVARGDILSQKEMAGLGCFDFVYAWGSLHHTGSLWKAIGQAAILVKPGGLFDLAIYNKHWSSPLWRQIKRVYCVSPRPIQKTLLAAYQTAEWLRIALVKRRNPSRFIQEYSRQRGMIWKEDLRDWLGGYPYEYASPKEIRHFLGQRGFTLLKETPNRSLGCSEFLFRKP